MIKLDTQVTWGPSKDILDGYTPIKIFSFVLFVHASRPVRNRERKNGVVKLSFAYFSFFLLWERAVSHHHRLPGKLTLYSFPFWLYSRFVKHSGRDLFLSFLSMTHAQENTFKNTIKNGIRIDSHCSTFMTLKKIYMCWPCVLKTPFVLQLVIIHMSHPSVSLV